MDPLCVNVPRVVIAGATSGVGKTTVSVAIMASLRRKGYKVQPFKVGPDFIDPSYHALVTRRPSHNLDVWMMGRNGVLECFMRACENADLAVIEGVMGLFDGMSGKDNFASTAHVAKILKSPVILVVDCSKAARSVAAIVLGFLLFDRNVKIAGVILNNVASERHAGYLREAFASKVSAPILGIVMRDRSMKLEERHLGLVPAQELEMARRAVIVRTAKVIAQQIRTDEVIEKMGTEPLHHVPSRMSPRRNSVTIGVALDESFNFYYQDNLEALRNAGAKLEFFSPVNDKRLPDGIDGVILGGGFPEVLADRLENNTGMRKSIRDGIDAGLPLYAECGGLMYLSRSIRGYKGTEKKRKMLGIVEADTIMTGQLVLNYTEAKCVSRLFGKTVLRGHEFHYSSMQDISADTTFAYSLNRGKGIVEGKDGIAFSESGIAAYSHLHFTGNHLAVRLVNSCAAHSRK